MVVLRAWLPLGVGLDDKAAEVRNRPIDLVGLRRPPGTDARVQGIGRGQSPNLDRRAEPGSQIHLDAVGAKDSGDSRDLHEVCRSEDSRVGVHVREHRAVDPDRRVGPRVIAVARVDRVREPGPLPQRRSGVAALHGAVEVVPVVEQAEAVARGAHHVQPCERFVGLEQAQQVKHAVQDADVAVRGDDDRMVAPYRQRPDDEPLGSRIAQRRGEWQRRDRGRIRRRSHDQRAIACRRVRDRHRASQQSVQAKGELVTRGLHRRLARRKDQLADGGAIFSEAGGIGDSRVAQPQVVPIFRCGDLPASAAE